MSRYSINHNELLETTAAGPAFATSQRPSSAGLTKIISRRKSGIICCVSSLAIILSLSDYALSETLVPVSSAEKAITSTGDYKIIDSSPPVTSPAGLLVFRPSDGSGHFSIIYDSAIGGSIRFERVGTFVASVDLVNNGYILSPNGIGAAFVRSSSVSIVNNGIIESNNQWGNNAIELSANSVNDNLYIENSGKIITSTGNAIANRLDSGTRYKTADIHNKNSGLMDSEKGLTIYAADYIKFTNDGNIKVSNGSIYLNALDDVDVLWRDGSIDGNLSLNGKNIDVLIESDMYNGSNFLSANASNHGTLKYSSIDFSTNASNISGFDEIIFDNTKAMLTSGSGLALKTNGITSLMNNSDVALYHNGIHRTNIDVHNTSTLRVGTGISNVIVDGYFNNSGNLNLQQGIVGDIFTINGLYSGNGATLSLDVNLGDDLSATDFLALKGGAAGSTNVIVNNFDGTGAQTNEGIKIIDVTGSSAATFSLLGDYVFEGDQAVVGGAYAYRLYQGATSAPDDGNWYLRSSLMPDDPDDPLYQSGVPIYESYPQALLGLNGLSTFQQRVGNRYWAGNGNRVIAQGADTIETYAPAEEAGVHIDANGVWGRIEGAHNKVDPRRSTSGADYSQNVFRMQAGADMLLNETTDGMLIGGVFAHYVHGKTKVRSIYGDGEISSDGYGVGGSLTWHGDEGFYVDGQGQVTWYDSNLSSTLAGTSLVSGNKGFGYALSLETGKRFALTPEWSVTPQAQLTYSNVRFDSFHDVWGAHVSLDKGSSLQGRLGMTLDHESSWQNAAGLTDRAHVYGIANLYYGFTEGTKVNVASEQFTQEQERLWGGLGVGGSYNWNDDKYSIYGEGLVNTSLSSFGDSYTLKGNIGFRVKW